jgi:hypothetical protein
VPSLLLRFPTRTPERSDRDALFGSPVIGSRRVLGERTSRVVRACCQALSIRSQSDARGAGARQPCCHLPSMVVTTLATQALIPGGTGRHQMKSVPLLSSQDGPGRVPSGRLGPTRNRKVVGSNPTSGSISAAQGLLSKTSRFGVRLVVATSRPGTGAGAASGWLSGEYAAASSGCISRGLILWPGRVLRPTCVCAACGTDLMSVALLPSVDARHDWGAAQPSASGRRRASWRDWASKWRSPDHSSPSSSQ